METTISKYQRYIEHHSYMISSHCSNQSGAFSKEDLASAGNEQLAIFIDNGSLDTLKEGAIKLRLRGAMIDELRKFTHFDKRRKTSPMSIDQEMVVDNIAFSAPGKFPSGIDFNNLILDLTVREQQILKMHYFQSIEFLSIAKMWNISERRAYQIHTSALEKIRKKLEMDLKFK